MGSPRQQHKKYRTPNNPFEKARMVEELEYLGKFGLRNKREFWKHKYQLSRFRQLTRESRALPEEEQVQKFHELRAKMARLGLVAADCQTDDVLSLTIENVLSRRLQTFVFKLGLAKSIYQARQLVVHRHIIVGDKVVDSPSYIVKRVEEEKIRYAPNSPLAGDRSKIWGLGKPAPEDSTLEEDD